MRKIVKVRKLTKKEIANLLIDRGIAFQDLAKRLVRLGQCETKEEALLLCDYIVAEETGLLLALNDMPQHFERGVRR